MSDYPNRESQMQQPNRLERSVSRRDSDRELMRSNDPLLLNANPTDQSYGASDYRGLNRMNSKFSSSKK